MTARTGRKNERSNRGAFQLAEFAPALYVLFILVLMPLLMNDTNLAGMYSDNVGAQQVRIIVTQ
jgi:hypothetical protein